MVSESESKSSLLIRFPPQSRLIPLLDADIDDVLVVVGVALDDVECEVLRNEVLLNGIDIVRSGSSPGSSSADILIDDCCALL